jgi:RimJ/RimL family protein N-acetyltransferase
MTPLDLAPVRTERLLLRPLGNDDVDDVARYQGDPEVARFLPYEPRNRATVAAKIAEWGEHRRVAAEGDYLQLGVERLDDGLLLGDVYFSLRSAQHELAVVGWVFAPESRGNGYATEAARALLSLAFDDMGLHRVIAELDARNTASAAVCTRLGMREEARFVEDFHYKGEWADTRVHAVLAREWRDGRQRA